METNLGRPPLASELRLIQEANEVFLKDMRGGAWTNTAVPPCDPPDFSHWSILEERHVPPFIKRCSHRELVSVVKTIQKHYSFGYDAWHQMVMRFANNTRNPEQVHILVLGSYVFHYKRDLLDGRLPWTEVGQAPFNYDKGKSGKGKGDYFGGKLPGDQDPYESRHSDWDTGIPTGAGGGRYRPYGYGRHGYSDHGKGVSHSQGYGASNSWSNYTGPGTEKGAGGSASQPEKGTGAHWHPFVQESSSSSEGSGQSESDPDKA